MENEKFKSMELLAPAGTIEAFEAAVEAGADAIYIGAPGLNARALAKHFSVAEVAAMIDHGHRNKVRVYAAMNSLMKEEEVGQAVEVLAALDGLGVDAVIMQDLGIYRIASKYFPNLRLHASTLMGAHNSLNVRQFTEMGFKRVVLARELSLDEIGRIHKESAVELEVFVHGALCFAYSGLCMFSSYLGGKSGLRGRCVQPCRRRYTWGGAGKPGQAGYLFSMNDLSGLELIPQLAKAGVSSLKIEGRMRSPQYVGSVVRAYRQVLDAPDDPQAMAEAQDLLGQAMGRKESTGYFLSGQPKDIIAPQHSGNIGLFLGKVAKARGGQAVLGLKEPVFKGDRLRLHQEGSGERHAFTLKEIRVDGKPAAKGPAGASVELALPVQAQAGDSLYKVDSGERRQQAGKKGAVQPGRFAKKVSGLVNKPYVKQIVQDLLGRTRRPTLAKKQAAEQPRGRNMGRRSRSVEFPLEWWLKVDDLELLKQHLPATPSRVVVMLSRDTYGQLARHRKLLIPHQRRLVWALPPVILEDDLNFYREAIAALLKDGFQAWQLSHIGQRRLFAGALARQQAAVPVKPGKKKGQRPVRQARRLVFFGDYTLNVLNSLTLQTLEELGISRAQLAIETDRQNVIDFFSHKSALPTGITIYGCPPLFTARLTPDFFQYDRPLVSPKGEVIVLHRRWGQTVAVDPQPFSLVPFLAELAAQGVQYGVVDLSNMRPRKGELAAIFRQLGGAGRGRRQSSFNYSGSLL